MKNMLGFHSCPPNAKLCNPLAYTIEEDAIGSKLKASLDNGKLSLKNQ